MAQQNKIGNSDKSQTAVELLHKESNELITKYLDGKIDARELITMHHNILYPHKEMEKEQVINACIHTASELSNVGLSDTTINAEIELAEQYYNETYKP